MNIFVPILKVDAARREVYGVMAEEALDKSNEIFDYDSSKPYVKAWVEDFEKTTDGKSFGNVRAMHSSIAAGKLIGVEFNDLKKCIPIAAKIVDDNEWKKVEEGVYTGFSIGGKYIKKWVDPGTTATRYTAKPSEVSIVDNPCMPGAKFTMVKADGIEEQREFAGREIIVLDGRTYQLVKEAKTKTVSGEKLSSSSFAYVGDPDKTDTWKLPIHDASHVRNALARFSQTEGIPEGEKSKVLARIKAKAKELGIEVSDDAGKLAKSLWDVGRCAEVIQSLAWIHESLEYEADYENDGSLIPGRLKAAVENLVAILIDLAAEEGRELTASLVSKFFKGEKEMANELLEKRLTELTESIKKDFDEKLKKLSAEHKAHLEAVKTHLDGASDHLSKCMDGMDGKAAPGGSAAAASEFISIGKASDGADIFKRNPAFVTATPGASTANAALEAFKTDVDAKFKTLTELVEKIAKQPAAASGAHTGRAEIDANKGANADGKSKTPIRFVPGGVEKSAESMELMKAAREHREPVNPEVLEAAAAAR